MGVSNERFEEEWARNGKAFIKFNSVDGDNTFDNAIISAVKSAEGSVTSTQGNTTDGLTEGDDSVMYKEHPGVESGMEFTIKKMKQKWQRR